MYGVRLYAVSKPHMSNNNEGDIMGFLDDKNVNTQAAIGHAMGNAMGNAVDETGSRSTLVSRNITVLGRRTSVRLEPEMWSALREIARREDCKIHDICSLIHLRKNQDTSLTAAIRVFLMLYYRAAATEEGHHRAGHGDFDHMIQRARMPAELMSWKRARRRVGPIMPAERPAAMRYSSGMNEMQPGA